MDYAGPAAVEWRANATFAVAASVRVEVAAVAAGWRAQAISLSREDHWMLLFLDNPFVLRFPDGSSFDVAIGHPGPGGRFDIWAWDAQDQHQPRCQACGGHLTRAAVEDGSGGDLSGPVTITDVCDDCGERQHATHYLHDVRD